MIALAKGKSTRRSVFIDANPETDIIRVMAQLCYGIIPGAGIS
jgi:hypothetical protein